MAALPTWLEAAQLPVEVRELLCFGRFELGPNVRIAPGGAFCHGADETRLDDIISAVRALLDGQS
jgi:hypothetical protein